MVTEGTDKAIPSYLAVVMSLYPVWLFPKSQDCPLGTDGAGSHWPGSGYKGRKGSSGKGAFSRSTRCSRSIQHCGVWRRKREVTSAGNLSPSPSYLSPPPHLTPASPFPFTWTPVREGPSAPHFSLVGRSRTSRKQSCSPTSCLHWNLTQASIPVLPASLTQPLVRPQSASVLLTLRESRVCSPRQNSGLSTSVGTT